MCFLVVPATGFTNYVAKESTPVSPYLSWATAATHIQDAIDVCPSGSTVLVSNGTYRLGSRLVEGTLPCRVALTNSITLRSVNGPDHTIISGAGPMGASAVRCVFIQDGSGLNGFTLTQGHTQTGFSMDGYGGGAYCEDNGWITACRIVSNQAHHGGGVYGGLVTDSAFLGNRSDVRGGGKYGGTADRCVFRDNESGDDGGGAYYTTLLNTLLVENEAQGRGGGAGNSTLKGCTVVYNSASEQGGGIYSGLEENSIIYHNSSPLYPDFVNHYIGIMNSCCTWPLPTFGGGHTTNAPVFQNPTAGDYRLEPGSPGIDAGRPGDLEADLGGVTRPLDGNGDGVVRLDLGAYEYLLPGADSDGDLMPDGWEWEHGLQPGDASDAYTNADGDPSTNMEEYRADTDPGDNASWFRVGTISGALPGVEFTSSTNRLYSLYWSAGLHPGTWHPVTGYIGIRGNGGPEQWSDADASSSRFYRLEVEMP